MTRTILKATLVIAALASFGASTSALADRGDDHNKTFRSYVGNLSSHSVAMRKLVRHFDARNSIARQSGGRCRVTQRTIYLRNDRFWGDQTFVCHYVR